MSEPKAEDKAAKKLKDRGIRYVMAIEGTCTLGAIRRDLNSQILQLCGTRRAFKRNRDGNRVFHDFDATAVHDPQLERLAWGFGIQLAQEFLRLFNVVAVDSEDHVAVADSGAIKRCFWLGIVDP